LIADKVKKYVGDVAVQEGLELERYLEVQHAGVRYVLEARLKRPLIQEVVEQTSIVAL